MDFSRADLRDLFESVHGAHSRPVYWYVLAPWIEAHADEREWLHSFATRPGPVPHADPEELWRLYALGRINETLLLRFQRGRADGTDWPGPEISPDDYLRFAESLGMSIAESSSFSPFYHEIVEVEQVPDDDQPIRLESTLWPCLMLGELLFSRAGARVSGGRRFIRKDVAELSTLYWAYRRKNRPYQDQSQGWGSNSQWRTSFRRDYRRGPELLYNVDGTRDLNALGATAEDPDGLSLAEEIELLTNRCFVRTARPHDDLYPYGNTIREGT